MGYGGRRGGHFHGHRGHRGGFRHRRHHRHRWRVGWRRRRYYGYYYGGHHVYHTRAYYVGAETGTQPPPQPPYTVIYETKSQFQTIKVVEFTNQPIAGSATASGILPGQQLVIVNPNATATVGTTATMANDAPPPYNPEGNNNTIQSNMIQSNAVQMSTVQTNVIQSNVPLASTDEQKTNSQLMTVVAVGGTTVQGGRHKGLVLENEIQFSTLDEQDYHNALVHSGMDCLIGANKTEMLRVLIIGGGDCCCVRELVKYDKEVLTEITMIEIDQMVVDTCRQYFPAFTEGLKDQRVRVIYNDANVWVKQQIANNTMYNYDLIICDLTEDGTISEPLLNTDFWNNLSKMLKMDVNGNVEGIIIRNGYHKPLIYANNNENNIILNNQYFISTNLPTFGGKYVFTIISHAPLYGNLTDFVNADRCIADKNGGRPISTKLSLANENELMYSYNWYFYNPEPEEPWYSRYRAWIILTVIIVIIIIIIVASEDSDSGGGGGGSSGSSGSGSGSGGSGGGGGGGGPSLL